MSSMTSSNLVHTCSVITGSLLCVDVSMAWTCTTAVLLWVCVSVFVFVRWERPVLSSERLRWWAGVGCVRYCARDERLDRLRADLNTAWWSRGKHDEVLKTKRFFWLLSPSSSLIGMMIQRKARRSFANKTILLTSESVKFPDGAWMRLPVHYSY